VVERDEQRAADLQNYPNLSQETHDIDLVNAVQDTLSQTKSYAQQNSDLQALWQTCDFCAPPMAQALDQLGLSGEDRPFTGSFYTTEQSREMISGGKLSGAVEINFGAMSWVTLDQALEFWARKTPFAKTNAVFQDGYGIEILEPWIVTQENIGDPAVVRNQGEDYVTYFKTKWNAEFGVGNPAG
jgi:ABC-type sugar transport system substrate-binding protein